MVSFEIFFKKIIQNLVTRCMTLYEKLLHYSWAYRGSKKKKLIQCFFFYDEWLTSLKRIYLSHTRYLLMLLCTYLLKCQIFYYILMHINLLSCWHIMLLVQFVFRFYFSYFMHFVSETMLMITAVVMQDKVLYAGNNLTV